MLTNLIKTALGAFCPQTLEVLRAINARRRSTALEMRIGATTVAQKIAGTFGMEVHSGPFRGMRFPDSLRSRAIGPKLLGTYECELHGTVADAIADAPDRIAIVGSAEGYYAVGLARAILGAKALAFDIDPWARARCGELARLNGVAARVETRSFCAEKDLLALRGVRALVLSDCEGFEYRLFTPQVITALADSTVIVETHPHAVGGDNAALALAFCGTHAVHMIRFAGRGHLPRELNGVPLSDAEFAAAVDECRPAGQEWLCAKPLQRHW